MSERVTKIGMRAFRGVHTELILEFPHGVSAVVLGENGTGKSTVADALEWFFTGEVELLQHEGRSGSLRHVGAAPSEQTSVTVETTGVLGGILAPGDAPNDGVRAAGRELFLLRGRVLTSFVESTKGQKWRALAELLGLDEIDQLRLDLQRARNELQDGAAAAAGELKAAANPLVHRMSEVSASQILGVVTHLCCSADVTPPSSLDQALEPAWAQSLVGAPDTSKAVRVARLAADLDTFQPENGEAQALDQWNLVLKSQSSADRARLELFKAADSLLSEACADTCPLCGQAVDHEALCGQVRQVLDQLRQSADELQQAAAGVRRSADLMNRSAEKMAVLRGFGLELGIEMPATPESPMLVLNSAVDQHQPVEPLLAAKFAEVTSTWQAAASRAVHAAIVPPPTPRDSTLVELGVLVSLARSWRERVATNEQARIAAQYADAVFDSYAAQQNSYVSGILDRISGRVAEIYAKLHPGEALADVRIEPWGHKGAELAVSFHGSRQKPPHGVLSESHLNSLAVALFLAMADTFNQDLDFVVLDDVVNSFDIDHRGELAKFLANDFSHRQLLVLTHDQLFFDRLTRLAPSWKRVEFTSWDYAEGPRLTTYQTGTILEKAHAASSNGDRVTAAMMGRRALEELLQETCEGLAAPLPFRRGAKNDRREIGEVLPGVRRSLKEAARPTYNSLKPLLDALDADVAATLNPEAHASRVNPSLAEVRAALKRVSDLNAKLTCPSQACRTRPWHRGTPPIVQCKCGQTRFPPTSAPELT
ncbi:MAG TPA: AAA family ATPase [Streptosporangiaceae bacterium]|nr:AAA family ATPase [Streptosporangiaceae bacterium]